MPQMTIAGIILVATFVCFFHPKVPNVVVALGAAIAFGLTGIVDPATLFNNFQFNLYSHDWHDDHWRRYVPNGIGRLDWQPAH